jgi:4,5-dihydroxyphthalate decarboxylase
LRITVAAGPYAHLASLGTGSDGLEVSLETLEPGHIFPRMLREAPWDVAEMSLATAYILAAKGDRRFRPMPVFPSRAFRHSALYVPAAGRVRTAADLRGARIGVLRYAMTTAVWVRAMLAGQYGVPAEGMKWFVGEDSAHPASVSPEIVGGAAALERMAVEGGLDCLISGRTPAAFAEGRLRRLFADFGAEEKAYFASSGVFPIMHVMVAKAELLERAPDVLARLMQRFEAAKHAAEEGFANFDISTYPLPWLPAYVEDARRAFSMGAGADLWPYGVEPNRRTLATFGQAIAAEGLAARALAPEEVFAA